MRTLRAVLLTVLASLAACGPVSDEELGTLQSGLTQVTSFGSNPGALKMYTYVPSGMPAKAPLVVALHGCTMGASDYVNAGWNALADQWKFYVVYPEDTSALRCFAWFDLSQNKRGYGQALSVKQMVDYMASHYGVDPARVFVTGLSAGGGLTATMLAAYPDVFAAGAPMAGLPYRCADTMGDSGACMGSGKNQSPQTWGDLVRGAYPGYTGPYPRVSIWQGASDYTVSTKNSTELMDQWTNVLGIDNLADVTSRVETATRSEYQDATGRTLVETWLVDSMGHGTAVKPGYQPANGCGQAGNFVLSAGICSTYHAARFFGLDTTPTQLDAGTTPPVDAGTLPTEDAGVQPGEDAGTPAGPDASQPGPDAAQPPYCQEWCASNYAHEQAGRGVKCGTGGSYVCAVGSNDNLGLWSLGISSWVRETSPGYYEAGRCDAVSVPDAGTVQPDASQPAGPDASQPAGPDASEPAGPDASEPAGPDASEPAGPDASEPAGPDASEPAGPDASQPAGPDASQPAGPDASEPAGPDAAKPAGPDASSPLDPPTPDAGRKADAGSPSDDASEFFGCGTSGAALPWLAPLMLGLLRRRRK